MTLKEQGFFHPAEWYNHASTWLSWPHNLDTWYDGSLQKILPKYAEFIKCVAKGELVNINVLDQSMVDLATEYLSQADVELSNVRFHFHSTNDSWCRDHGPDFVIHPTKHLKVALDWGYNAWGGKYPPFNDDNAIPQKAANVLGIPYVTPGIVLEGGSVDFNGEGTVLTTESCLLNKNRNPHLLKPQIQQLLIDNFGVEQVVWLGEGITGDDTDGHVDDITRFVSANKIVTVVEHNKSDVNYQPLKENLEHLNSLTLVNGKSLDVIELPMPKPFYYKKDRLPASYANFYIANAAVVVPIFNDANDQKALDIIGSCFPDREVVGIYSGDIIMGLGSFHCLSKQEPAI